VIIAAGVEMKRYSNRAKKFFFLWCEQCQEEMMVRSVLQPNRRKHSCGSWAKPRYTGVGDIYKSDDKIARKVFNYGVDGMNKDQAEKFYQTSIESAKQRIDGVGGAGHYTPMVPDMDYMVKTGQAKKVSDADAAKRVQIQKELVTSTAGNKKINPKRSNNKQSF
jgi:hypothetical protein